MERWKEEVREGERWKERKNKWREKTMGDERERERE